MVFVSSSTAGVPGPAPTVTVLGLFAHPLVSLALQVTPSMTETVFPEKSPEGPLLAT
jgi:hypothetical protein